MSATNSVPDVLVCGTGEYTTGYVHGKQSASDKKVGVVCLTLFDLKSDHRGKKVNTIKLVGTNGTKFPGIREHFAQKIGKVYKDMPIDFVSFPNDDVKSDPVAYKAAIASMNKGDIVIIFTPDDTHFDIAKEAIQKGLHVQLTKPPVKTLKEHQELIELAKKHNVLVSVEYHKRFDPMYADARERIRTFGDFNYYYSYMAQPKFQLDTFKAWAGKSSDISYYLNSHHVDIHCWSLEGLAIPTRVIAMKSTGIATSEPFNLDKNCEDTITLTVQWVNLNSKHVGTAVYTASWATPKADVHSQQRFFYMGHKGEITIDQAHRGYTVTTDDSGFASVNPLYMKYTTDEKGRFAGQNGYGYRSIELFVEAATKVRNGQAKPEDFDATLPTLASTLTGTAILYAGRLSLDNNGRAVVIKYDASNVPTSVELE